VSHLAHCRKEAWWPLLQAHGALLALLRPLGLPTAP